MCCEVSESTLKMHDCSNCSHIDVCKLKEEYLKYISSIYVDKGKPQFVTLDVKCAHYNGLYCVRENGAR